MEIEKLVAVLFVGLFFGILCLCAVEEYYKTNATERLIMHGVPSLEARCAVHKC